MSQVDLKRRVLKQVQKLHCVGAHPSGSCLHQDHFHNLLFWSSLAQRVNEGLFIP